MAINESNDGQDLALELKKDFEEKIKEVIEGLKEGETTISQEGIQLVSTKGQYIMSVRGIPVAIIAKTGKDSYEFNYNLNNIQELEEVLKQNEEEFELFKDTYNVVIDNLKEGVIYNYSDMGIYKYVVVGNTNTINKIK